MSDFFIKVEELKANKKSEALENKKPTELLQELEAVRTKANTKYNAEQLQKDHIVYAHPTVVQIHYDNSILRVSYYVPSHMITMRERQKRMLNLTGDVTHSKMRPLDDGNNKELVKSFKNSILLLPTAQTLNMIPISFWEKLASRYTSKGYRVFTNYNGFEYEIMIKNTTPLSSSIVELAINAPYFTQVISMRSGACELLSQTKTNLIILYNRLVDKDDIILEKDELGKDSIFDLIDSDLIKNYQYVENMQEILINTLLEQL